MTLPDARYLDIINTTASVLLFAMGLACLLSQRSLIKQVIGLRIMVQGVALSLIHAGYLLRDTNRAQAMVISMLVVEAIVISIGLAMIVNAFRHYPSGDIDRLNRLKG